MITEGSATNSFSRGSRALLAEALKRGLSLGEGETGPPLWVPYPGSPQEKALHSSADVIGFGGAAGGGKSDLLLGLAITAHHKAIVFRRTHPLLKDLVGRSREIIGDSASYNGQDKTWRWPGGRSFEFGAVQYENDVNNYRGRPHDLKGFDELTEFSEYQFRFLAGWLRTTRPGQRCRVVATFNPPSTQDGKWVIRYFAPWVDRRHHNPAKPGELRWYAMVDDAETERPDGEPFEHGGETITPTSRTFFSSRLADNPRLMATGYGRTLMAMPEPLRSQLLYGDFDADATVNPWQLIPTKWVEAAMERWKSRNPDVPMNVLGMDVAHGGKDKTVLAPRYGDYFGALKKYPGSATPDGRTAAAYAYQAYEPGATVNVDAIGYGASAHEHLAAMTYEPPEAVVTPAEPTGLTNVPVPYRQPPPARPHAIRAAAINVGEASHFRDRSGKYKMANKRAEMYWRLREALDPEFGATLALPPDPELLADLTAPAYEITPQGIRVEKKDAIKERQGGRSPDCGDAVALAMLGEEKYGFL